MRQKPMKKPMENIMGKSVKEFQMDKDTTFSLMEWSMLGSGKMGKKMDRELSLSQMETSM